MKNIVFMVNIVHDRRSKSQGYDWCIKGWKKWCDKNNCELFVLDEFVYPLEQMKPQWHKLLVFDLLDNSGIEYDKIMFVDSDTIPNPNSPNFFELTDNFGAVANIGSFDWICRSMENYSATLFDNFMFPYWQYINSGVMIFNKSHKDLFKKIIDFYWKNREKIIWMQNNYGVGTDQPVINFFLHKEKVKLDILPYEYNMHDMMRLEVIGTDFLHCRYGYIYHFNAGVKPSPGFWAKETYHYLYSHGEANIIDWKGETSQATNLTMTQERVNNRGIK